MKRMKWNAPVGALSMSLVLVACGALNAALTDAQNRAVLVDVSGEAADTTDGNPGSDLPPPECRSNPIKDNCATDAETYCADYLPSAEDTSTEAVAKAAEEKRCGENMAKRREQHHELLACLKTNIDNLTVACQDAVNAAPEDKGSDHQGPPPGEGPGKGQRPPPRDCGGQSPLKDCVADAHTLCEAELPLPGEPDGLTPEERHAAVVAIVTCLTGQSDSLSVACKAAIDALPQDR